MKSFRKNALSTSTCLATFALVAFGTATAAQAQSAAPADAAEACADADSDGTCDATGETKAIVVTGSRIARPNLESTVPIASIGGSEFTSEGQSNIGDTLNELPQLRSTFSQQNPGLGIGIAGLNLLDLRGLGTSRTLVLVNGRRHVAADILNNAVSPDINSIPADLIDRVDIVTGGNSAIYGSDAIAGVVNFVLRRDYNGLQLRANVGVMDGGWGGGQYASIMFGRNFADGRGNITLHGEWSHQDRVFASQVDWIKSNDGFAVNDVDTGGLAGNSDGIPDNIFYRDFRSTTIHRWGLIPVNNTTANPACGSGFVATNGPASTVGGTPFNCTYIFQPEGTMVAQTGTRFGTGVNSSIIGGNGQTGREGQLLSVVPRYDRYNINMLAHYEFSDAAEVFFEGKWNRINTLGSNAGPSFIQGQFGQFDYRERVRLDNPFLGAANRTTLTNAILASGCNVSLGTTCASARTNAGNFGDATLGTGGALNATDIGRINAGTYRVVVARHLTDSGIRDEDFQRDTYRFVVGMRGKFNDDWNYELSFNYGKFSEDTTTYGYLDRQRFVLAMDAGLNPATGTIQCRAQFDPASAVRFARSGLSAAQIADYTARLTSDIAACVPYNPFGAADNRASAAYFTYNARHKASLDQMVVSAFMGGDTSGFFNLPGGPISFAIGAEYRREKAQYIGDPYVEGGYTSAVSGLSFNPDPFEVKEAYGEINIPILADTPFFHQLTVSGAVRVADYKVGGTAWAYNGGVQWAPVDGLMFRGNYARAVRAPNVSETASGLVPNFAPGFGDPCSASRINNGSATRAANCLSAIGAPLLATLPDTTYSLQVLSGSNPNLNSEQSDSWTAGAVFQPKFMPGFSLTVDYYHIKVDGIIASLTAQQIANLCYDQATLTNPFCGLFTRYLGPGTGSLGEAPGQIQGNTLLQAPFNYASRVREGVDTQVTYRANLGGQWKLRTDLIWTHNFTISNFQDPTRPAFEDRLLEELGDPKDEFRWDTDLTYGNFTFGYRMRYIGPMYITTFEATQPLPSACTTSCPPTNADFADTLKYPDVFYHDIRFELNVPEGGIGKSMQFYLGVNNVLDTHPPLGSTATGVGSAIYDYRGRNFYAGMRARF
jgi:outer membrane receptor protein involved in Fe transport